MTLKADFFILGNSIFFIQRTLRIFQTFLVIRVMCLRFRFVAVILTNINFIS